MAKGKFKTMYLSTPGPRNRATYFLALSLSDAGDRGINPFCDPGANALSLLQDLEGFCVALQTMGSE
jgi:hypothetical protein